MKKISYVGLALTGVLGCIPDSHYEVLHKRVGGYEITLEHIDSDRSDLKAGDRMMYGDKLDLNTNGPIWFRVKNPKPDGSFDSVTMSSPKRFYCFGNSNSIEDRYRCTKQEIDSVRGVSKFPNK